MQPSRHWSLALAFLLIPAALSAQASGAAPEARDSGRNAIPGGSPTQPRFIPTSVTLALADTLLRAMDLDRVMQVGAMAAFDAGAQQQPMMAQLRDVMVAWSARHLNWAEMGAAMTELYAETFSESELRAYVAFYRTPAGRTLAERAPELTQRGAKIGAEVSARYMAELQQMIQARLVELQSGAKIP